MQKIIILDFGSQTTQLIGRRVSELNGAQLLSWTFGGKVESAGTREYGRANLNYIDPDSRLFRGISAPAQVWMSHGDTITAIPEGIDCQHRQTACTALLEGS